MDDDDYMDEKYLNLQEEEEISRKRLKRKVEEEMKASKKKVSEKDVMRRGLQTAIPKENKGYQMLMKMGYKPTSDDKLIKFNFEKKKRVGLGLGKNVDNKKDEENFDIKNHEENLDALKHKRNIDFNLFRSEMSSKHKEKRLENEFRKALSTLETLNEAMDIPTDPFDSENIDEGLQKVCLQLRNVHLFCHWCGNKFDNQADMELNCPGDLEEDH